MKTWNLLNVKAGDIPEPIVTMGVYDGVHKGHQALFAKVCSYTKTLNSLPLVITFANHPSSIVRNTCPVTIMSLERRLALIQKYGIDRCLLIHFDKKISALSAQEFVLTYFVEKLKIKGIVIGENFRFGYKGLGTPSLLKEMGEQYNFFVDIQKPIIWQQEVVSSTRVRKSIEEGNCCDARQMLGRPFSVFGTVVPGNKRGRELGFPTANLSLDHSLIPQDGIYLGATFYKNSRYPSLVSVGDNPTFSDAKKTVEVYLHGLNEDIYGKNIETFLLQKIRGQIKFEGIDALIKQMENDRNIMLRDFSRQIEVLSPFEKEIFR